jgi:aminopeptidase N
MKTVTRLYTQFQPKQYDLRIDIDENAMRFVGSVKIDGKKIGRPSQRITFHSNGLKVTDALIVKHDKKGDLSLGLKRINNHKLLQEVRIHSESMLYPGDYTIELKFEAPLTKGMTGIYPCFFKDAGIDKQLIMTQFESHHAREAFPCIDEPEAKAVFNLTLMTRPDISVLSNTPIKSQKDLSGQMQTVFESTPKMSSYLLAFVLGELICKSSKTKRGTDVNVWATVAQPENSLDFALDVSTRSIEFFEDYFGVEYPLSKADHVACPDFSSGAMENWGLITYRERVLLAYPGETAQSTLEQVALVVAHETSHQWFGNLVTMQWWNDLWLNESFANLMEYRAVDSLFPEWHIWNSFVAAEGLSALRRDAVAGVQAVRTEVHHPDEISTLFDPSIVYAKGGRLLYMLMNYIGEEAFRKGLKYYFETHAYDNTEGSDLWSALSESSGKDIGKFMTPWLTRSGFPLVSVSQSGQIVTLSQEHFQDNPEKADLERIWPVPIFTDLTNQSDILDSREKKITTDTTDTLLINKGARGHFIVRYVNDDQKKSVLNLVANQTMDESDRLMLLNGGSMMAKAGYEPYGEVLSMLKAYDKEASETVWDMISLVIGECRRFVDLDENLDASIKPFVDKIVAPQVMRLGWNAIDAESSADTKLRALVLGLSAYAENTDVIKKAEKLFASFMNDPATVPVELRALVFTVPVKKGNNDAFNLLLKLHDTTQNGDLKSDACDALTETRDLEKARLLLSRLTNSELVRPQDVDRWLVYLLRNRFTRGTAWNWMVDNWGWLEDTFKNDKSYDYLPRYAASCVNTREYQDKFRSLFESKQDQLLLKRNIELGLEEIANRLNWLERDLTSVQRFFIA